MGGTITLASLVAMNEVLEKRCKNITKNIGAWCFVECSNGCSGVCFKPKACSVEVRSVYSVKLVVNHNVDKLKLVAIF